jgi:hypothetical protein
MITLTLREVVEFGFACSASRSNGLGSCSLLEVLDVFKAGEAGERIRVAAETMYQALIETELSATIGAQPGSTPVAHR